MASWADGHRGLLLGKSPNGHLHLALVVALAAASVIALAVPIRHTRAAAEPGAGSPVPAPGSGLSAVLREQAADVVAALPGPQEVEAGQGDGPSVASVVPERLLAAASRLIAGSLFGGGDGAALAELRAVPVWFTVHEDGFVAMYASAEMTVGPALASAGVSLNPADLVVPSLDSDLTAGMHVYVTHADRVRLVVDGREQILYTQAATVGELLAEAGVSLNPEDLVYPELDAPVARGLNVGVVTVRDGKMVEETAIAFQTVYTYDASYPEGQEVVVQEGADGYVRKEYRVQQVAGKETGLELLSETRVEPTNRVVAIGTAVKSAPAPNPTPTVVTAEAPPESGACAKTQLVWATWYTATSAGGNGTTATGTGVYKGILAVDPSVIPLGTRMYIPGYGYGVAADTGGGVKGNFIDLGYGPNDVYDWRTGWVDICILG